MTPVTRHLLLPLLMLLVLAGCASDPFEDITLESHYLSAKDLDEIKMQLKPGFLVRGELKDKTSFRFEVAMTDDTFIHGKQGEKIRFDKLDHIEYLSPDDFALLPRVSRMVLAALLVVVMALAALVDAIVRLISGS